MLIYPYSSDISYANSLTFLDLYIKTRTTENTNVAIPEYTEITISAFCIFLHSVIVMKIYNFLSHKLNL